MFKLSCVAAALLTLAVSAQADPLKAGDLFVYRVGDGSAALGSSATAVFLDEYSLAGTLVQSIALSTNASVASGLTASGSATSEGLLTLSTDQKSIVLTGYGAALGTAGVAATAAATTPRVVGVVNVASGSADTSTRLTNFSTGNNIRGVASTDGTNLWVSGAATGVAYTTVGSSSATALSTTVANIRSVEIFGGQLDASTSSGSSVRLGTVGSGLPTSAGQTITNLPGFATSGSPYAFYFADLSSSVAGLDTLYVADDAAGITKYSLVGGNWASNGTVGAASDTFRGLAGSVTGGVVSLFTSNGSKLSALSDASGYNGSFAATVATIATAGTNTAFRGVAFLPAAVPEPGTYALMALGLLSIGLLVQTRRG